MSATTTSNPSENKYSQILSKEDDFSANTLDGTKGALGAQTSGPIAPCGRSLHQKENQDGTSTNDEGGTAQEKSWETGQFPIDQANDTTAEGSIISKTHREIELENRIVRLETSLAEVVAALTDATRYSPQPQRRDSRKSRIHFRNQSSQSLKCHFVPTSDLDESSEERDHPDEIIQSRNTRSDVHSPVTEDFTGTRKNKSDLFGSDGTSSFPMADPMSTLSNQPKSPNRRKKRFSKPFSPLRRRSEKSRLGKLASIYNNNEKEGSYEFGHGAEFGEYSALSPGQRINPGESIKLPFRPKDESPQKSMLVESLSLLRAHEEPDAHHSFKDVNSTKGESQETESQEIKEQSSIPSDRDDGQASSPPTPPPSVEYRAFSDAQVEELRRRSNSIMSDSERATRSHLPTTVSASRPRSVSRGGNGNVSPQGESFDNPTLIKTAIDAPTTLTDVEGFAVQEQLCQRNSDVGSPAQDGERMGPLLENEDNLGTLHVSKNNAPCSSSELANVEMKQSVSTACAQEGSREKRPQPQVVSSIGGVPANSTMLARPKSLTRDHDSSPTEPARPANPASKPLRPLEEVLGYVRHEMLGDKDEGSPEKNCDRNMEEFLRVPSHLERLQSFGIIVCLDCYLNVLTILPLKFVLGVACLIWTAFQKKTNTKLLFSRKYMYKMLQFLNVLTVYHVVCQISVGKLYHWVRGQTMMKLYLVTAIVEVFDRLMCSFGQDALDSMYWNTTRRPYHRKMIVSYAIASVYVLLHSLVLMVHITTLNVAMNSADSALISLLIGGNFAEIKSTVFKKYNKKNLFQIAMSDICERFKLYLFMFLITLLNLSQGSNTYHTMKGFLRMGVLVMASETLSDWIKHSFIAKFNFIPSNVYDDYALIIAGDVTGIGHEGVNIDHTHAVVKRVGLAQLPLLCVTMRYLTEALRYSYITYTDTSRILHICIMTFVALLVVKVATGVILRKLAEKTVMDVSRNKAPPVEVRKDAQGKPLRKVV
jgi:hypothetical protein